MNRAERDAAVEKVVFFLSALWNEHKAQCKDDPCVATGQMEDSLKALYQLRKGR